MALAPYNGITIVFINNLKPIPKTIPTIRVITQLFGRMYPRSDHGVFERNFHTNIKSPPRGKNTMPVMNKSPPRSMKRMESVPINPDPRRSAANWSIGNAGSLFSRFELGKWSCIFDISYDR